MVATTRYGPTVPQPDDLERFQLGFCTTTNELYIKDGDDRIINLTKGRPEHWLDFGEVTINLPEENDEPRFYELATINNVDFTKNITLKFDVTYYHKVRSNSNPLDAEFTTEMMIGTVFTSIDIENEQRDINIYGAITNLLNKDLHICINGPQAATDKITLYFVADKCRGGYCRINNVEIFNNPNAKVRYMRPNVIEFVGEISSINGLFPFMVPPTNG